MATGDAPLGTQVGAVAIAVGGFLVLLGVLGWITLRLSGGEADAGTPLKDRVSSNPYEVTLSMLARLVQPGLLIVAIGFAVAVISYGIAGLF